MAIWAGAAIDDLPHCAMHFDMPTQAGFFNLGRQPWLMVNVNGERFMNEDLPWALEVAQMLQQPGHIGWAVWDEKWADEYPIMKSQCCKNMGEPTNLWNDAALPEAVEAGTVFKADTLEELAGLIGVPAETFVATAARYTELASNGVDEDYGKHKDRLTTLEKAPYYATQIGCVNLVTLGGMKVNTSLQVLDTEGQVIPGTIRGRQRVGMLLWGRVPNYGARFEPWPGLDVWPAGGVERGCGGVEQTAIRH